MISTIFANKIDKPTLIVVPPNLISQWRSEITKWYSDLNKEFNKDLPEDEQKRLVGQFYGKGCTTIANDFDKYTIILGNTFC